MSIWLLGILGFLGSSILAWFAYKKQLLTPSGALGLILVGTTLMAIGPWPSWGAMFLFFFGSATISLFIRLGWLPKPNSAVVQKSGPRDGWQVFANAFPACLFLVIGQLFQQPSLTLAYYAAMAAGTADTFASELGIYSRQKPFWLLHRRRVVTGLSGGVTWLGTSASALGAFLMSLFLMISHAGNLAAAAFSPVTLGVSIFIFGCLGSLCDSLLGEWGQAVYQSPNEELSEIAAPNAVLIKGYPWLTNDAINFFSTLLMSLLAAIWFTIL